MFNNIFKIKYSSEVILLVLIISLFFLSDPFRVYYWSADHDLIILDRSLKLSFQSINYEHTGIGLFIFISFFFKIFSFFNISEGAYHNFVKDLSLENIENTIFLLRFLNCTILYIVILFIKKIFNFYKIPNFISILVISSLIFSKPFLGFFFEIRTDAFAFLLFIISSFLTITSGYLFLITFCITLAYATKMNIIPLIFVLPFLRLTKDLSGFKYLKKNNYDFIFIFFVFFNLIYFITFFNISLNGVNSLNTDIKLFNFGAYYQLILIIFYFLLIKILFSNIQIKYLRDILIGISFALIVCSFFISKYYYALLFNPIEHLTRFTPNSQNTFESLIKIFFNDNLSHYKSFFNDNYYFFSTLVLIIVLRLSLIDKLKLRKYDFLLLISYLVLNFQFTRDYFVRYEIYPLIILFLYLIILISQTAIKKNKLKLIITIYFLCNVIFPLLLFNNKIHYDPFISQEKNVSCEIGRDWIKGQLGNYLESLCS